jgi:hypothetical protein
VVAVAKLNVIALAVWEKKRLMKIAQLAAAMVFMFALPVMALAKKKIINEFFTIYLGENDEIQ